jgi:hypothetical protein
VCGASRVRWTSENVGSESCLIPVGLIGPVLAQQVIWKSEISNCQRGISNS